MINIINLQCIYVVFGLIYFMTLVADIQVLSQSLLTDKHLPCLLPYISCRPSNVPTCTYTSVFHFIDPL